MDRKLNSDAWADITAVVGELRALHDVLASPSIPESIEVSYENLGYTIWDGVSGTQTGEVRVRRGISESFVSLLDTILDEVDGPIALAEENHDTIIDNIEASIEREEARLEIIAKRLRQKYAQVEMLLDSWNAQGQALTAALSALA